MKQLLAFLLIVLFSFSTITQAQNTILTGADQLDQYLPLLKNKKVALVVNQTSQINGILLPDTLLKRGVEITKIFSPEHGFRGGADAGAHVKNGIDEQTSLPVFSLYGNSKKPDATLLKDVDVIIYDLQDVGVRFYTYISTLQYIMEACVENNKELIILDRPNPLGFIVDGPVLNLKHRSFVGMQAIPVLYGMTPGEYAKMLLGEKWIPLTNLQLSVIPLQNYTHKSLYSLPVSPSPNLKEMTAVYLYPSLCFFEGTVISVGRGTDAPFTLFGHPDLKDYAFLFTPTSKPGAVNPPLKGKLCYGEKIAHNPIQALDSIDGKLQLKWLLDSYKNFPNKEKFFNSFFEKLSGNDELRQQIIAGKTEAEIRESWEADLAKFKKIRSKYLLYP